MAEEGRPGGPLGGEDGQGEAESGEAPGVSLDPTAAAMAARAAEGDPALAVEAAAYFRTQRRLVSIQTEHLHEQRVLILSHLRLRRVSDWFRVLTQFLVLIAVVAILLGLGFILQNAFVSKAVVVDTFETPPALAAQGLSGKAVASSVLDALQRLQNATRAFEKGLSTQSAWSSEVKIEIPEAGVSIGEIDRLLRRYLGNDIHIEGELIQTDGGNLSLTVRGDGVPAKSFSGPKTDLDKIAIQAAEHIYSRSQPVQFAEYLQDASRFQEMLSFSQAAFAEADSDEQRAELANSWGSALSFLGRHREAEDKYRLAIGFNPHSWKARGNLLWEMIITDGEEAAWRQAKAELRAAAQAPESDRSLLEVSLLWPVSFLTWDMPQLLQSTLAEASRNKGRGTNYTPAGAEVADVYGEMHDPQSAQRYLALSDPNHPYTAVEGLFLQGRDAEERNDPLSVVAAMSALARMVPKDPEALYTDNYCFAGWALGMAGRMEEANAVFNQLGTLSRCAALRGDVLEHAGDLAGAQRIWAENIKIAPDLPQVYLHRGLSALRRGDLKAAEADFVTANHNAPHFADPLKAWGDLDAQEGRWSDALEKYNEALTYAPNWARLQEARDKAVQHTS